MNVPGPGLRLPTLTVEFTPNADGLFSKKYMIDVASDDYQGAGTKKLRKAMHEIVNAAPGTVPMEALSRVAEARGLSQDKVVSDYERYIIIIIKGQNERIAASTGKPPAPPLLRPWKKNYGIVRAIVERASGGGCL